MPARRPPETNDGQQALADAIVLVAQGDQAALRRIFDSTSAKLKSVCVRILRNDIEAEDALQDIYVIVWRRAPTFDPRKGNAASWLATIARNLAIDRLRSQHVRTTHAPLEVALDVPSDDPDALAQALAKREGARVHHCLTLLEARTQAAIRTAFFDGLSYPELASRAGVPLGTMKSLIRRGLKRLRDCLRRD